MNLSYRRGHVVVLWNLLVVLSVGFLSSACTERKISIGILNSTIGSEDPGTENPGTENPSIDETSYSWSFYSYIKAANSESLDFFGYSVSMSGDTLAVGASTEDSSQSTITNGTSASADNNATDSGAVYIYKRNGKDWSQEAYIKAGNVGFNDYFGYSLSLHEDTLAVGAIFEDSSQSIITNGTSSATDNELLDAGAVYVYRRTNTGWIQEAYVKATNPGSSDVFGASLGIHRDTLAVGATGESSSLTVISNGVKPTSDEGSLNSGAVYIYRRSGVSWSYEAFLKSSNSNSGDGFGVSLSLQGNILAVGANNESSCQTTIINNSSSASSDNSCLYAGAVYIFNRQGNIWSQTAYIKASNGEKSDAFGSQLSLSDSRLAVGAINESSNQTTITNTVNTASSDNSTQNSGAVYIYYFNGTIWNQEAYIKAKNSDLEDMFGYKVSLNGPLLAVHSWGDSSTHRGIVQGNSDIPLDNTVSKSGAVFLYRRIGNQWQQEAYIKSPNADADDYFGSALDIDGNTLVVGAYAEDSSSTIISNSATASEDNGSSSSGAIYIYTRNEAKAVIGSKFPTAASNSLQVVIGGYDIISYKYKIGLASTTDCADTTGYSDFLPVSTPITNDLSTYPDGELVLCILGQQANGLVQLPQKATAYKWIKDLTAPLFTAGAVSDEGLTTWPLGYQTPQFSWTRPTDTGTDVVQYEIALGTQAGAADFVGWTTISGSLTSWKFHNIMTTYGDEVYFSIRAKDAAGNASPVARSDGYTVACDLTQAWCPQAYFKAVNAEAVDLYGTSVSVSGRRIAISSPNESSNQTTITNGTGASASNSLAASGAVYVYVKDLTTQVWTQEAYIKASNASSSDYFGSVLVLDQDTLAVGAYKEDSVQTEITNGPAATVNDSLMDSGAVYIYRNKSSGWQQEAYIKAVNSTTSDYFGEAVALSGNTLAVAASSEDSNKMDITNGSTASIDNSSANSGAVYLFKRTGVEWAQEAYFKASNSNPSDFYGKSIALNADTLVVGAVGESSNETTITNGDTSASANNSSAYSGAVYVYTRTGNSYWAQQAYIKASNSEAYDYFGNAVALSGDSLAVGASSEDSAQYVITNGTTASLDNTMTNSGAVYVYRRNSAQWVQEAYIKPLRNRAAGLFGYSLSLQDGLLAVGVVGDASRQKTISNGNVILDNSELSEAGAVYIYRRNASQQWSHEAYIKAPNSDVGDKFGSSVSLSAGNLIVGAPYEDSSSTTILANGLAAKDNLAQNSGAAYLYNLTAGVARDNRFVRVDIDYSHLRIGEATRVYVEYSDNEVTWSEAKSMDLVANSRNIYTLTWEDKGVHRYWRLKFVDPSDLVLQISDKLYEITFQQLNGLRVSPSVAARHSSTFNDAVKAEDGDSETYATFMSSEDVGYLGWDFQF